MTISTPIYVFIVFAVQRSQRLVQVHYSDGSQDRSPISLLRSCWQFSPVYLLKMSLLRSIPTPHETAGPDKTSRRFHGQSAR
jgi:hypothetical protein